MARYAVSARPDWLDRGAREALKIRVLDALGCALGACGADPTERVRRYVDTMGGAPRSLLIGGGGAATSPPLAALHNGFLVRYLDYNDSYLAPGETCHPSDNLAAVLAAAEDAGADGNQLLTGLAVAYQIQCRLCDHAPVRDRGFDHTVQGIYAATAGAAHVLGLDVDRTTHAIAIAGTAFNSLRITRTGQLSQWKGLAYPNAAFCAVHAVYLAKMGITGPTAVFEGNKGFMQIISGPFEIDWEQEGFDSIESTSVKRYNAEIHSQSALEALQELRAQHELEADRIERVDIEIFDVAYRIIGGGEEGDKFEVATKEQADHSLPYLCAVMLIDGEVTPRQYRPERILAEDVQRLLRRVHVEPNESLSRRFPAELPCRAVVTMRDGARYAGEKSSYRGFRSDPMTWREAVDKFQELAEATPDRQRAAVVDCIRHIETRTAADLAERLAACRPHP